MPERFEVLTAVNVKMLCWGGAVVWLTDTIFVWKKQAFIFPCRVSTCGKFYPEDGTLARIYQNRRCRILEDSNLCCRTYWKPISCRLTLYITHSYAAIGPFTLACTITVIVRLTLWRRNYFFFNFSTPCI